MALLNIIDGYLSFGADPILNHASFSIEEKERLCIVGRNGSGKSTLMSIITEERDLDSGRIEKASNLKIVKLQQDPPKFPHKTALEFVLEGFSEAFSYIREYNELLNNSEANHDKILELQTKIETLEGWNLNPKAHEILSKLQIDPNIDIFDLSGGMKRKVLLAQVLMQNPDILLLDEPTNHLDIETVKWLEDFLMKFNKSVVFVSHDRAFIENLATRIVDIDRGVITSYPGKYKKYLESKQIDLEIEEATNTEFDKKLAIEEKWIRKGVKARGTRNEGRVKNLKELRREKEDRIKVKGSVEINSNQIENGGMVVYKINNLNLNFENNIILKDFTAKISQGEKIALIGPNGSGKTTFINMLLGEINPTSGTIKEGTGIEIAYFDQLRSQLDDEKTVLENVADGAMFVNINGKPKHVMGELKKFLFDAKRVNSPVKSLSGGEKNRLLLVKILLRPHNVFILDEPTNDLDIDTLMLLENYLKS
ncbi:MAG: ATP-binding cassette domain-containing protein, partial [Psittacicella sp.]